MTKSLGLCLSILGWQIKNRNKAKIRDSMETNDLSAYDAFEPAYPAPTIRKLYLYLTFSN